MGVLAVLAAGVGLTGCETEPPVLTVAPPSFLVGGQLGPSERGVNPDEPDLISPTPQIPMLLRWTASDNNSACSLRYSARKRVDFGGNWDLFEEATTTEMLVSAGDYPEDGPSGRFAGWAIKAHDCSNNTSSESYLSRRASVIQENGLAADDHQSGYTVSATPGAGWVSVASEDYSGGEALRSSTPGASVTLTSDFGSNGSPVAVVAQAGPPRGSGASDILVDGNPVSTIEPEFGQSLPRTITWSGHTPPGTHTITVRLVSGELTVDAFLIHRRCC